MSRRKRQENRNRIIVVHSRTGEYHGILYLFAVFSLDLLFCADFVK